jgi:hypothetical protein
MRTPASCCFSGGWRYCSSRTVRHRHQEVNLNQGPICADQSEPSNELRRRAGSPNCARASPASMAPLCPVPETPIRQSPSPLPDPSSEVKSVSGPYQFFFLTLPELTPLHPLPLEECGPDKTSGAQGEGDLAGVVLPSFFPVYSRIPSIAAPSPQPPGPIRRPLQLPTVNLHPPAKKLSTGSSTSSQSAQRLR